MRLFRSVGLTHDGWASNETLVKLDERVPPLAPPSGNADSIPDAYWSLLAKIESGNQLDQG